MAFQQVTYGFVNDEMSALSKLRLRYEDRQDSGLGIYTGACFGSWYKYYDPEKTLMLRLHLHEVALQGLISFVKDQSNGNIGLEVLDQSSSSSDFVWTTLKITTTSGVYSDLGRYHALYVVCVMIRLIMEGETGILDLDPSLYVPFTEKSLIALNVVQSMRLGGGHALFSFSYKGDYLNYISSEIFCDGFLTPELVNELVKTTPAIGLTKNYENGEGYIPVRYKGNKTYMYKDSTPSQTAFIFSSLCIETGLDLESVAKQLKQIKTLDNLKEELGISVSIEKEPIEVYDQEDEEEFEDEEDIEDDEEDLEDEEDIEKDELDDEPDEVEIDPRVFRRVQLFISFMSDPRWKSRSVEKVLASFPDYQDLAKEAIRVGAIRSIKNSNGFIRISL